MTEILAHGYSSQSTQQELSNEYQQVGLNGFQKSLHYFAIVHFVSSNVDCDPVLLTLQDEDLLDGLCVLRRISHGTVLTKQGEQDASMVFVVTGTLQVLQQVVGHEDESVSINNPYAAGD